MAAADGDRWVAEEGWDVAADGVELLAVELERCDASCRWASTSARDKSMMLPNSVSASSSTSTVYSK